ncbi:MAG: MotA/TolQ/ExbB proton channel family protein [Planctomycetota bacterium]|jgi:biopolymer transport protein ExbB
MIEEIVEKWTAGGPLMAPIAAVSLCAWALIVERWLWLRGAGRPQRLLGALAGASASRDLDEAERVCAAHPGVAARAASRVLASMRRAPAGAADDLIREASLRDFSPAKRRFPAIAVLASVAPLLGLLGTVTGMIDTFEAITLFGTGNPRSLAEGISEALITTQAGLIVALPTLLAANVLTRRADRFLRTAEDVLKRIRLMVDVDD